MTSLSDRFLHALRTFDADVLTQVLAPDAIGWRNLGNRERSAEEIVESIRLERTLVRSSTIHVRHQASTEDGFVVQFVFEGTTRGGADFHIPICIVAHVVDGRIGSFDEYTDEASVRPLHEEFLATTQHNGAVTS